MTFRSWVVDIKPNRITRVNAAKYSRQWSVRGMDEKMNVVGHQAICVDFKLAFLQRGKCLIQI